MISFNDITNIEQVTQWILNFDFSHTALPKDGVLRGWLNGKFNCLQILQGRVPIGWMLWSITNDGYLFIHAFTMDAVGLWKVCPHLEEKFGKLRGYRFQSTLSEKFWGKRLPGVKVKHIVYEKEFTDESILENLTKDFDRWGS